MLEGSPIEQRGKLRHKEGTKDWDGARTHAKSPGGSPGEQVVQQGRLGRDCGGLSAGSRQCSLGQRQSNHLTPPRAHQAGCDQEDAEGVGGGSAGGDSRSGKVCSSSKGETWDYRVTQHLHS